MDVRHKTMAIVVESRASVILHSCQNVKSAFENKIGENKMVREFLYRGETFGDTGHARPGKEEIFLILMTEEDNK